MSLFRAAKQSAYGRLHRMSLTRRLVTVVVVMVFVAYLVTTFLTATLMRSYLVEQADEQLTEAITPLAKVVYGEIYAEMNGGEPPQAFIQPNPYYLVFIDRETATVTEPFPDPELAKGRRPVLDSAVWGRADLRRGPYTVESVDGTTSWRMLAGPLDTRDGTVALAVPMEPVTSTVKQLLLLITIIAIVVLLAVGVIGWFAVRRAFRPLSRIEDTAAAIAAGDLTRRVPEPGADDEVGSLSHSLNAMLARIEQSFAVREASERRMRQFVADASHELRTPLATVKGYAELYRHGAVRSPDEVAMAMRRIEDEASRMARLVEDLLLLTRLDTQREPQRAPVDLTVVTADTVQDARVRSTDRRIDLVPLGAGLGAVMVLGDDHALRQVVTNLVANAVNHTSPGTPVEVAVGVQQGHGVVEVRDRGEGIAPDVVERIFERFVRADPSRARGNGGGTGLGLAIVAAIVARHGGTVRHVPTPGGGATFRVELPLSSAQEVEDAARPGNAQARPRLS